MSILTDSPMIYKYKEIMSRCIRMYYPDMDRREIDRVLDYSIQKRYKKADAIIDNSYTHKSINMDLLALTDYIQSREPILTAFGAMFRKHGEVPNPLAITIQSFLDKRSENKKIMFRYPKGSEMFERYNLLQSLN
jgi:hypothetical protein